MLTRRPTSRFRVKSARIKQTEVGADRKKLLAVVFACTKFHDYIYAKEVIIESDHKPLETIFKKQLEKAPARLQNMLLKLQKYNLKVVYK